MRSLYAVFAVLLGLAAVVFAVSPTPVLARLMEKWPYDRLFKEADVVVLATAVKTELTDDKAPNHDWPLEFVGQITTFRILHVSKGKTDDQIRLLHFRFGELKPGIDRNNPVDRAIMDGPNLVAFRAKSVTVSVGSEKKTLPAPQYLLFLKRLDDGRFVCVSGQIDPSLSIREVYEPLRELDSK